MSEKRIPELRFKGFTDVWEQRKLGEFSKKSGLKNRDDENIPAYSVSNILGLIPQGEQFEESRLDDLDKTAYKFVLPNEFAYNPARINVGSIAYNKLNFKVIVSSLYVVVQMDERIDDEFILHYIKSSGFINEVRRNTEGSVREYLFYENFANIKFPYTPNIEEQKKIGSFFATLDRTITFHQRKLEKLKELKKAYLQVMFPQGGETVPRLRFCGFEGDWEQRKLGEISDKVTEKNKKNEFDETLTNSAEHGIINQREFFDKDISNEKNLDSYYIVRNDDFVYNPRISNFAPVGPIKRNKLGRTGVMSPLYYVFSCKEIDLTFLEYFFETIIWHKYMVLNGDSGARSDRFAIKDIVFQEMPLPFPDIVEQRQVGVFLEILSKTITLHQQKLEHLQQLKKAYLQKMFI